MAQVGFLILLLLLSPGIALLVLGVIGLVRRKDLMTRLLAGVALTVGAAMTLTIIIALIVRLPPWSWLLTEIALGAGLAALVFWVAMLTDCALNETLENNEKLVWVLIIIFTQIIGALIYFFARRLRRISG